jgi:hypothetical protein
VLFLQKISLNEGFLQQPVLQVAAAMRYKAAHCLVVNTAAAVKEARASGAAFAALPLRLGTWILLFRKFF